MYDPLCFKPENRKYDWHSDDPEVQDICKDLCLDCPVMLECAQFAMKTGEIWGIWGGMDTFKMRRALAVDSTNRPRKRIAKQLCPFCDNPELVYSSKKTNDQYDVSCTRCNLVWKSYVVPSKLEKSLERKYGEDLGKRVV